jgi:uncharacterized membrane protein
MRFCGHTCAGVVVLLSGIGLLMLVQRTYRLSEVLQSRGPNLTIRIAWAGRPQTTRMQKLRA